MKQHLKITAFAVLTLLLLLSFYKNPSWLELCAGLAFFLFGMQCMQGGLKKLAGGKLEKFLAQSTSTPFKSFLFGVTSTTILQSTTVVALLIIAFVSTQLIALPAAIAIIIGANLGSSGSMWLLALAGQNVSLSPFAYPLVVVGILTSFAGNKAKAFGRILIGIAFILLAIELIKNGFSFMSESIDFSSYQAATLLDTLFLLLVGLVITIILQSSHATIILILTALGLAQINLQSAYALTIGAIIGSAIATGIIGILNGDRAGIRVAIMHIIYSIATGLLVLIFLSPITWFIATIATAFSLNELIQTAFFYTVFNIIGVMLFLPLTRQFAIKLAVLIPDNKQNVSLIEVSVLENSIAEKPTPLSARYLTDNALTSTQSATKAVAQELNSLAELSLGLICNIFFLPKDFLEKKELTMADIESFEDSDVWKSDHLYRIYIKQIYSELLTFISKIEALEENEECQSLLINYQAQAFKLASAIKNSQYIQNNLRDYLQKDSALPAREFYLQIRQYILEHLRVYYQFSQEKNIIEINEASGDFIEETDYKIINYPLDQLPMKTTIFEKNFKIQLYESLKNNKINGFNTSSILNDLGYALQITASLQEIFSTHSHEKEEAL